MTLNADISSGDDGLQTVPTIYDIDTSTMCHDIVLVH